MTDTQERIYIPTIGTRVKLRFWNDYVSRGMEPWTALTCTGVDGDNVVCIRSLTTNGEHDGDLVTVPVNVVDAPVGWRPRYTIHVAPDKVAEVLAWLPRGIVVRFSQYIGDGSTAFRPADNAGQPHWKYGEVTDTIPATQTRDLIEVVKLESECDAGLPCPCPYCAGTGKHASNPALEAQSKAASNCPQCGVHTGFSFVAPWHHTQTPYSYPANGQCAHIYPAGACWCCNGTGKGTKHLSGMEPRKERKLAIAELERQGWKVWYQKRGATWWMERETTVKGFGQDAKQGTEVRSDV